ncbi:MAG: hypothetical protein GY742_04520, partial [Hyphomicrobiales bacterium]|nr:hypothetical protein [Hyphomicrobiales bacterium]
MSSFDLATQTSVILSAQSSADFSVSPMPVFNLVVLVSDVPDFAMSATCDGGTATVTGTPGGPFSFNPLPTDGAVIDLSTGAVTGGTPGATYTIEYTTPGVCPQTSQAIVTVLDSEDSDFTMAPTCDGGTATITG